jgi:ABC-type proline/glycine betaine transport system permease subunit
LRRSKRAGDLRLYCEKLARTTHLAWQHTVFVGIALAIAIVTGVP